MGFEQLGGWINDPDAVQAVLATMPRPTFALAAPGLMASGEGKTVLLYKAWKDVNNGQYIPYVAQEIGDCVSMGWGHGTDLLSASQISINKSNEEFHQTATEAVYGMARVDIGGGRSLGREGGEYDRHGEQGRGRTVLGNACQTVGCQRRACRRQIAGDRAQGADRRARHDTARG
jgi:hypothetical protein